MKGKEAIERLQEITRSCTQELFAGFGCQLRPAKSDESSEMGPCTRAAVSGSHVNGTILIAASPALLRSTAAGDDVTRELELDWLCEVSNLMLARVRTLAMQQGGLDSPAVFPQEAA